MLWRKMQAERFILALLGLGRAPGRARGARRAPYSNRRTAPIGNCLPRKWRAASWIFVPRQTVKASSPRLPTVSSLRFLPPAQVGRSSAAYPASPRWRWELNSAFPRQEIHLIWQPLIPAFEEEQRSLSRGFYVDDLADHNGVITAVMAFPNFTFDIAENALDHRRSIRAAAPV